MGTSVLLEPSNLPEKLNKLSSYCNDITNLKFDRLTVLYPSIYKKNDGSILWVCKCKCECGNYVLRSGADLKRKGKHHCGHHFKEDQCQNSLLLHNELNGQIFNNLQVIEFDHLENKRIFLKCKCLKCGNITIVRKDSLLNGHKSSCGCIHSKGESTIENILIQKGIIYKREFIFVDLIDKGNLRFDFALFKNDNVAGLLEYQGMQHFITSSGWNNDQHLYYTQNHDELKRKYCEDNNIPIYYITYNEDIKNKMEAILNDIYSE